MHSAFVFSLVVGFCFNLHSPTFFLPDYHSLNIDTIPAQRDAQDFNTTRSNLQNSNYIIVNVGNNNSNNNDTAPKKLYAQDFNTTRSNRQNSNYVIINVGDNSLNNNDTTPKKLYAQDFNTTRSNRQNSNYVIINVGNKNASNNDTIPIKHYAQDFNTTRSNRQNSNYSAGIIGDNNSNDNGSIPSRQEAQDYNSTRSNKANCVIIINVGNGGADNNDSLPSRQEAQDYNSSRSNKANSLRKNPLYNGSGNTGENPMYEGMSKNGSSEKTYQVADNVTLVIREINPGNNANRENKNPLYNGNNTAHENPLYNGNAITGNDGGNSTNNPGKQPARQEAQDYNSTRSNKANCLTIEEGVDFGNGRIHSGIGMNFSLGYTLPITRIISIEASAGYSFNKFEYAAPASLPDWFLTGAKRSVQDQPWRVATLQVGPAVQLGQKKLYATLYGKAGVSFIKIPEQVIGIIDEKGNVTDQNGLAKFSGNKTSFSIQTGVRLSYEISRSVDIFLNPHFFTTLNNIAYSEKNVTKAIGPDGNFNREIFMSLPFENKGNKFQSLGLNLGVRIRLMKQ